MSETMKKVESYKQQLLQELLKEITQEQRDFFYRLYLNGVSEQNMETAYGLIERTIKRNKEIL